MSSFLDSRGPSHLGLWNSTECEYTVEKQPRSLSVRTASGHCVSILNDEYPVSSGSSDSGSEGSYRSLQSDVRQSSSPLSFQSTPTRLPSLSALIESVSISNNDCEVTQLPPPSIQSYSPTHCVHFPRRQLSPAHPSAHLQIVPRTQNKRKYHCTYPGCGKSFTTSGHLSRHFRIHTGEKNYHCLYPGCTSRFSRQDNMMQHYRTHLSPRSRRNRSMRNAVATAAAAEHNSTLAGNSATVAAAAGGTFSAYKRSLVQTSPLTASHWKYF
ncbi:transcriptional repressor [Coemansia brasiliensis]|uniref:Transcriptional repressor n=1 Tax=Coemansia brasiliensis TaxID=2650707 RepID=A0A9W8M183_9FUNG|nr:transcriptional repressor [Coemansia brasiliensis]